MKDSVLLKKADQYAHRVYQATRTFPREELYGLTSQLRRAALSVPLNIIEGFARYGTKEFQQFLRISYASLQESQYLLEFSMREDHLDNDTLEEIREPGNEVAKMLWAALRTLNRRAAQ